LNPKSGWLATANHNILPPGYKHEIAYEFAAPYRFERVKANLDGKTKLTLEDFQRIQHDDVSIPGLQLAKLLGQCKFTNTEAEKYVSIMRNWDGHLSLDSQAGVLYEHWLPILQDAVYAQHVPKELVKEVAAKSGLPTLIRALENPDIKWFGPKPDEKRDQILVTTFRRTIEQVKTRFPDLEKMRWGTLHTVTFRHPLASMNPAYAKAFNIGPFERTGDGNTPNNTRYVDDFQQTHGASYRHVFDLADWDKGMATSAPGQSAQFGSPHYGDLAPMWAKGEYFPLAYSRKKVEEVTKNRLWLRPSN
jgi:penicillin amidase